MLKYSAEALDLKPQFYHFQNDIDVYVEDEDDEVFYEKLFEILLKDAVRIRRVFGVGGKTKLLERLQKYLAGPMMRVKFFVADGDFDRLLGRRFPETDRLHVLAEYCIENFLFEEAAIYAVMQEELPRVSLSQLKTMLNVSGWLQQCVQNLTPLFACFILIQKHGLGIENVKVGVGRFLTNRGTPQLDLTKITDFVSEVRTAHPQVGKRSFDEEMSRVQRRMGKTYRSKKRYICGKEYLLPLLRFEVTRSIRRDMKTESFRFRIMKNCRLRSLTSLKSQIKTVAPTSRSHPV
jgi:hypothetical protein